LGEADEAERVYRQSRDLYRNIGDERGALHLQLRLGVTAAARGDLARARSIWEAGLVRARELGDRAEEAGIIGNLGFLAAREGKFEEAADLTREALAAVRELGLPWFEAINLGNLAELSIELDRLTDAGGYAQEALAVASRIGDRLNTVWGLALHALLARRGGRRLEAGRLWGAVEAEAERAPLGRWDPGELRAKIVGDEPEFERGREAGRQLALEDAVREALSS
jgi:tetratricopeptide (TPR) repeat protein